MGYADLDCHNGLSPIHPAIERKLSVMQSLTGMDPSDCPDEIHDAHNHLVVKILPKKSVLWEGDKSICGHFVFIYKGLIRSYWMKDGKEQTIQFYTEDDFLLDHPSFIHQQKVDFTYEALEDCEVVMLPRNAIYEYYNHYKSWERIGRLVVEKLLLAEHQEKIMKMRCSPEEQYLHLMKNKPFLLNRIPLYIIASYIGITPEHLSRIRGKAAYA